MHYLKSDGAIAMFLSGLSEIIIQHIEHWASDTFLEYKREQVENFSFGVSQNMIIFEHFLNVN